MGLLHHTSLTLLCVRPFGEMTSIDDPISATFEPTSTKASTEKRPRRYIWLLHSIEIFIALLCSLPTYTCVVKESNNDFQQHPWHRSISSTRRWRKLHSWDEYQAGHRRVLTSNESIRDIFHMSFACLSCRAWNFACRSRRSKLVDKQQSSSNVRVKTKELSSDRTHPTGKRMLCYETRNVLACNIIDWKKTGSRRLHRPLP